MFFFSKGTPFDSTHFKCLQKICLWCFWCFWFFFSNGINFKINLFIGFKIIFNMCATRIGCNKTSKLTQMSSCESQYYFLSLSCSRLLEGKLRLRSWETQLRGGVKPLCLPGWDTQLARQQVEEGRGLGRIIVRRQCRTQTAYLACYCW